MNTQDFGVRCARAAGRWAGLTLLACCAVSRADRPDVIWTRAGHSAIVINVDLTPSGDRLMTSSLDGSVKVWDASGAMRYSVNRYGPASLSSDGSRIAVSVLGFLGGGTEVRSTADGSLIRRVGGANTFPAAPVWSPDAGRVGEIGADRVLRIFNVFDGTLAASLTGHTAAVRCSAWSPDGAFLLTGAGLQGVDNTARVWSAATGQQLRTLTGHGDYVSSVAISPDSQLIATGSGDRTIKLWQASNGALLRTITSLPWPVVDLCFSPAGTELASMEIGGPLRIWRVADGAPLREVPIPGGGRSVRYRADGLVMLVGSSTGPVELRSSQDGALLQAIGVQHHDLAGVRYSSDGRTLAYGHDVNSLGRVTRVAAADGTVIDERSLNGYVNANGAVFSPDVSRAGTLSLSSSDTSLWNLDTGGFLHEFVGHVSSTYDAEFSPDGLLFATGGEYQAGLWDATSGAFIRWFTNDVSASVAAVAFSRDGTKIAHANRQFAQVHDVSTGQLLHEFTTSAFGFSTIALSPDASLLAVASEQQVFVWRLADETLLWSEIGPAAAGTGLVFLPDGEHLMLSGRTGGIQIRSATDGAVLQSYDEETGYSVSSLALHPCGRTFAYTRSDATVVVAANPLWIAGDIDASREVNLDDYAAMAACLTGPGALADGGCACADLDADGDVDLADFATLHAAFAP